MNHSARPRQQAGWFYLAASVILLLAVSMRMINLMRFPLFYDEAIHLGDAHEIAAGDFFTGLDESNWLYCFSMAAFRPTGPEGPWISRGLAALISTLTGAICIALGCRLGDRRAGLLAGLFYALLPMAVFHERQALSEPQMVVFTTLSILLVVQIVRKPRLWLALPLGVALLLAVLTKLLAVAYLTLPAAGALIFWQRKGKGLAGLGVNLLGTLLALALITGTYRIAEASGLNVIGAFRPRQGNTMLGELLTPAFAARLHDDLVVIGDMLRRYIGPVMIGLLLLVIVWIVLGERRRAFLFLSLPALAFGLLPLLIDRTTGGDILPPRYFMPNTAPLVVMAALSLESLRTRLAQARPHAAGGAAAVLAALVVVPALAFDLQLIRDPRQAPLTDIDRNVQYHMSLHGDFSDVAEVLLDEWRAGDGQPVVVVASSIDIPMLNAQLGPRVVELMHYPRLVDLPTIARKVAAGRQVYVSRTVFNFDDPEQLPDLDGLRLEPMGTFVDFTADVELFRVSGLDGPLADEALAAQTPGPEKLAGDFDALDAAPLSPTVIVFPALYAPSLPDDAGHTIIPLEVGAWPVEAPAAGRALDGVPAIPDHQLFDLVLVDEAVSDPERALLTGLQNRAYHLDETWFGLLHRVTYVSGPASPDLPPVGAVYEDAIHLLSGGPLDTTIAPGEVLRLAFTWQTDEPIADRFKVFVHIIAEDGTLLAQSDAEPGAGLFPTTIWQPGQPVTDRLAIRLPESAPPGRYQVRVGLYFPESGVRLSVTQNGAGDFAPAGQVEVVSDLSAP